MQQNVWKTRPVLALLIAVAWGLPAPAQEPPAEEARPQERFEEEVEVTEVLLDVVVTDRQGNPVVGLDPKDFVVEEDGKRIPVESAVFYSSARLAEDPETLAARGIEVDLEPRDRFFIFFFHDAWKFTTGEINLMHQQARAGRDAKSWVREDLAPRDWVAVLSWDGSLTLHQDFTQDRGAITRAIDEAAARKRDRGDWPSRREMDEGPSLADDLPRGRDLRRLTQNVYAGLALVAHGSRDIRARKNLIYIGVGFGDLGPLGTYREDPRYFPALVQAFNDANIAVYPLDLLPSGVEHVFEHAMLQLAEMTGGRVMPLAGDFRTPLEKIDEDTTGYYLLSYRATHGADEEGFQRVRVETGNPQFQVRARRGYIYGAGPGEPPGE